MAFDIGSEVQSKRDPNKRGLIKSLGSVHAGLQYYVVFWGGIAGTKTVSEQDLQLYQATNTPEENLLNGNLAGYQDFQRLMTLQRLKRRHPLRNNIYAFNASRTRFYPYQFKPLIKFLDSPHHRLLICDEVGLGKTIEAGLILTELRARQSIKRVLVVCPANLRFKWKKELGDRFGEKFTIYESVSKFIDYLDEYEEKLDQAEINGIISFESIRNNRVLEQFEPLVPDFDLVIVDEAHHMRNPGRKQHKIGLLLSHSATAMIMLTATPVQLGLKNLYSLLNILDGEDFPDWSTTETRFRQNEPIVEAQICIGQIPPSFSDAATLIQRAGDSPWVKHHPLYPDILNRLTLYVTTDFSQQPQLNNAIITLQRDLAELNLIGHIFTRTRKREVQEDVAQRRAYALEIELTERERGFYNTVTAFVRAESEVRGDLPVIQQWRLNTPQRRMASSIPAMIAYYRKHLGFDTEDVPDDFDPESFDENDQDDLSSNFTDMRERLRHIVQTWPAEANDSKYHTLFVTLRGLKNEAGVIKVIIFAFFKGTLQYLHQRLKQDGFKAVMITGDSPNDERPGIIDTFQNNPEIEILLSSRVGSEGLDFQFCDTLFNYDLPWNPMELEQRIGRIDRIGQESKVIHIYNLWIKDSIEERILKRLYERVGIFKHSIGDIEVILGEVVRQLEQEVFSKRLSIEEENERTEQALRNLGRRIHDLEQLEHDAAHFIGTDAYFADEVEAIKRQRRYITGEQLRRFVEDFLRNYAPRTRFEYDPQKNLGQLFPDQYLRDFIIRRRKTSVLSHFLASQRQGLKITFDSQVAFRHSSIEFINVLHPLIIAITEEYDENPDKITNAQHVVLQTKLLKEGFYIYFVFLLRVHAAKGRTTLECVILNEALESACDPVLAEMVFGEMVEQGEDPKGRALKLEPTYIDKACRQAEKIFHQRVAELRAEIERNNDSFVERRLTSLDVSYRKNIDQKHNQLKQAQDQQQQERYIRMLQGTIRRLEGELAEKRNELEQQRKIEVEYDKITVGILEVQKLTE